MWLDVCWWYDLLVETVCCVTNYRDRLSWCLQISPSPVGKIWEISQMLSTSLSSVFAKKTGWKGKDGSTSTILSLYSWCSSWSTAVFRRLVTSNWSCLVDDLSQQSEVGWIPMRLHASPSTAGGGTELNTTTWGLQTQWMPQGQRQFSIVAVHELNSPASGSTSWSWGVSNVFTRRFVSL